MIASALAPSQRIRWPSAKGTSSTASTGPVSWAWTAGGPPRRGGGGDGAGDGPRRGEPDLRCCRRDRIDPMNRRTFHQCALGTAWAAPVIAAVRQGDKLDGAADVLTRAVVGGQVHAAVLYVRHR